MKKLLLIIIAFIVSSCSFMAENEKSIDIATDEYEMFKKAKSECKYEVIIGHKERVPVVSYKNNGDGTIMVLYPSYENYRFSIDSVLIVGNCAIKFR